MDGEITIGTRLETDKFDRQIAQLEKKLQKEEQKAQLKIQTRTSQEQALERERAQTDKLAQKYEELLHYKKEYERAMKTMESADFPAEKWIEAQKTVFELAPLLGGKNGEFSKITEMESQLGKAVAREEQLESQIRRTEEGYQGIVNKVNEYKSKIENIKIQKQVSEVDRMKESFKGVGSSIQSSINKVARLALGVFGVRSAFMALRRASSDLASYDQQYAANLEYIRYALTQAIAPVLRYIVSLAATLLGYINAILQGWFGINLFSRGSAESFNKMKAGASGASKAVKEIKKQLAGFDEINMLTDQSDTGTSAGAGGVGMPNFDLSAMQGEPPEWLKWIIDHRDLILAIMGGIAGALVAWRLGLGGIKALGIGVLIAGIITTIQNLIKYLKDPSWKNFGGIIQGIGLAILGVGILIGGIPAIVTGAIVLIVGTIIKYWEQIKAFFQRGIDWLIGKSDWVHKMFGDVIGNIYDMFVRNLQQILNFFDAFFRMVKGVFDGIIQFIKGVFTGNWQQAWEGIKNIFSSIWNGIAQIFTSIFNMITNMVVTVARTTGSIISGAFKAVVNAVLWTIEKVLNAPIRAVNKLISVINAVPRNKFGIFKHV